MTGGTITGNKADKGGAMYLENVPEFTIGAGCSLTGNEASEGGALYLAGTSVLKLDGAELSGNTAETGSAVYLEASSTFDHAGGTLSGEVYAYGSYRINAASEDLSVSEKIYLVNTEMPLTLYGDAVNLKNKIRIYASHAFADGSIIVDGNEDTPAMLSDFTVDGVVAAESENDIVGQGSADVFWDPAQASTSSNDDNQGTGTDDAVVSWDRAAELLAQRGSGSRIVVCSQ
jgi:hypothetical protein